MRELKIGEEIRIRCVEDSDRTCEKCVFNIFGGDCGMVKCSRFDREDGKNVYYDIVEE